MFRPLTITAHLRCGVISDPWLPLDGVLLYEACRQRYGEAAQASIPGQGSLRGPKGGRHEPTLPLLLIQDGEFRYWACSFAEWGSPYSEGMDHWNKRDDSSKLADLLDLDVRSVNTGSGRYKAYHMPVFYRVAPWVRWWAIGDPDTIRKLVTGMCGLGKKRAYGWGDVIRWEVAEASEDRSVIVGGVPQRSVPVTERTTGLVTAGKVLLWGYYPPYYDRDNHTGCYMPERTRVVDG